MEEDKELELKEKQIAELSNKVIELKTEYENAIKMNIELSKQLQESRTAIKTLVAETIEHGFTLSHQNDEMEDKSFRAKFHVPSASVRSKILELNCSYAEEQQAVEEKYKEIKDLKEIPFPQLSSSEMVITTKYNLEINNLYSKFILNAVRACIDTKQLTTEQKELIAQAYDSEFWQKQNFVELEQAFISFRGSAKV